MNQETNLKSKYSQVVDILNELQGEKVPSYQCLHAFWLNPDVFLNASLYGQRLIAPKDGEGTILETKKCCGSTMDAAIPIQPVAPEKTESCCGSQNQTQGEALEKMPDNSISCWPSGGPGGGGSGGGGPQIKRSEKSGIILGLKGEYPFDGQMFPKLLWDTQNVANADQIKTIADWIDSDCPLDIESENEGKAIQAQLSIRSTLHALAHGEALHKVSLNKTNVDQKEAKGLSIRKEISSLNPEELRTFREALSCMNQFNDYWQDERSFNYWARIHTNSCQHGWEQFVTWHRLYLYFFEQKLKDFNPDISLPYWSYTDYSDVNKTSFNNSKYDLGVIPEAYGCFLNTKGLMSLKNANTASNNTLFSSKEIAAFESLTKKGTVFNSGLRFLNAAGIEYEIINKNNAAVWSDKIRAIYKVLLDVNPLWFANRWPGSMGPLSTYPTKEDVDLILTINNFGDFGGGPSYDHHFGSLEKLHNGMHNFSGGTNPNFPGNANDNKPNKEWVDKYTKLNLNPDPQSLENPQYGWMTDNRVTAFDPLFWGHHSNVDRLWSVWQESHSGTPQEMNASLAPWALNVQDSMSIQKLGYQYMKDSVFYKVNNSLGLVKFKSEPAPVSLNTLDTHRKAEIKLHRVQSGNLLNARIRVFLNTPGANSSTPTVGNENFVEEINTFNGSCYGGPGHCNLPLENTRISDHRPLQHHEPRNYKIDATDAVNRVLNKGDKNITVQLVVTGLNGQVETNAVFMEGVSLNFMD
ncbi:tyrosinase family protein [Lacihabitans sp. LS3-19]|uniref:tyrosinase family protein n=1 Tax=Lacihabitans sp. LS3-19 TaxID=2487335 RepID=UPI0020CD475E|nr:tyrosinase family protein [Lacihabitans sp. LS3-19]MCP9769890.1 tyrosinase family protein [Lacihabitans sp. LS3-19]